MKHLSRKKSQSTKIKRKGKGEKETKLNTAQAF